jgi:hypothetical protein
MQRGGWQVGTNYVPSNISGTTDPTIQAAAAVAADAIAVTLNKSVRLLKKNRELQGELYQGGTLAFTWIAEQANEPSVLYYWAKLKYRLSLTDADADADADAGTTSIVMLVFKKRMNKVGVGLVVASVAVGATG